MYSVYLKRSAERELDSLPDAVFTRIREAILALEDDPRPPGCERIRGTRTGHRIRVGDYRIVFQVEDAPSYRVTIYRVAHRRAVYRRIQDLGIP